MATDVATRRGQACDRCRRRKVKCDGNVPSCGNCLSAGLDCEVSATLQRNRKVRGFVGIDQTPRLREEITRLQQLLDEERRTNKHLRNSPIASSSLSQERRCQSSIDGQTHQPLAQKTDTAYVLKHMGRMVSDEYGIGRFAGITTGSHFMQSLEAVWGLLLNTKQPFPDSCYRLFLTSPSSDFSRIDAPQGSWSTVGSGSILSMDEIHHFLSRPLAYYTDNVHVFMRKWESLCPIIVPSQLCDDLAAMCNGQERSQTSPVDYPTLMIILTLFAINQLDSFNDSQGSSPIVSDPGHIAMACCLRSVVTAQGSLKSLQALSLFAFYHQITGQSSKLADLGGLLVRMAQSLALHRHSRRFQMAHGEIEHRKRLWWWIYNLDKVSALVLGLPTLINEANVDIDLPSDCTIQDTWTINYPLPGDITPVFFFNQYVGLMKIMSSVLAQLYTTKERYGGAEKIARLDKDLQIWNYSFNNHHDAAPFEIGQHSDTAPSGNASDDMILYWLRFLANLTCIFIHRPGLTFDTTTKEFSKCLAMCSKSSGSILDLLDGAALPKSLQLMCPIGPNVAFQSALMHVYRHCISATIANTEGHPGKHVVGALSEAVVLLEGYRDREMSKTTQGITQSCYLESLSDAVATLQRFIPYLQPRLSPEVGPAPQDPDTVQRFGQTPLTLDYTSFSNTLDQELLDSLKYMDALDWMEPGMGSFPNPEMF